MIICKVSPNGDSYSTYPYKIHGVTREDYSIIMNFLNTINIADAACGYSETIQGDVVTEEEYNALCENAELLGIQFIEEKL